MTTALEKRQLHILLVDDDEDDYRAIRHMLADIAAGIELEWLAAFGPALEEIGRKRHDVYLIDHELGSFTGLDLLRGAIASGCTAPMILMTSRHDREVDLEAIKIGAADYLVKGEMNAFLLERSIRYAMERKRSEEALRKSEERLAKAQQIAHVGNWDWDIRTNDMYWSDEVYRILGRYPREFPASYEALLKAVHEDDRGGVNRLVNESLYERKLFSIEHRVVLPYGVERIVHQEGEVTYEETGKPLRMVGTVQDITERRRAEDRLRMMEEKFSKAFHASPDWIVMSSAADGRYIEVNDAFLNLTGFAREEVIGRTSLELGIWTDPAERLRMLKLLDEHGAVRDLEVSFRIKSGETRHMFWSADVIEFNGEACLIAVAQDVTEQMELEKELMESQVELYSKHEELSRLFSHVEVAKKEWEMTMDQIGDMVILADHEEKIRRCNRAFQKFLGIPFADIIGAGWRELLHKHGLMAGTASQKGKELHHKGSGRWFVLNSYPFQDPGMAELGGMVITIHDCTEHMEFTEKLEEMHRELERAYAELKGAPVRKRH